MAHHNRPHQAPPNTTSPNATPCHTVLHHTIPKHQHSMPPTTHPTHTATQLARPHHGRAKENRREHSTTRSRQAHLRHFLKTTVLCCQNNQTLFRSSRRSRRSHFWYFCLQLRSVAQSRRPASQRSRSSRQVAEFSGNNMEQFSFMQSFVGILLFDLSLCFLSWFHIFSHCFSHLVLHNDEMQLLDNGFSLFVCCVCPSESYLLANLGQFAWWMNPLVKYADLMINAENMISRTKINSTSSTCSAFFRGSKNRPTLDAPEYLRNVRCLQNPT